jgi:subtilase family serine protease
MSATSTLDSSATLLGTFEHFGALSAAASSNDAEQAVSPAGGTTTIGNTAPPPTSHSDTQQVDLPVGGSGSFYLIVETDLYGQVFENGATAHEVMAIPVTVNLTPPPDLKTSITAVPANALASHALTFTCQVSNAGAGATAFLEPDTAWNDTSATVPVNIVQKLADLQVTSITAPPKAQVAGSATIDWTVANNGSGTTNSNYWYDDV